MRRIEVTPGERYGRLEVQREATCSGRRRLWCKCDCGSYVKVRLDHLRSGRARSCGYCGVEYRGIRKTLVDWAREYGIPESTLRARLKVMGMGEALRRGK